MSRLRECGPAIASSLAAMAADTNEVEIGRVRAIDTLAEVLPPAAETLAVLGRLIAGDPSAHVRWSAAKAAGAIGDASVIPALQQAAQRDTGQIEPMPGFRLSVAEAAQEALRKLSRYGG